MDKIATSEVFPSKRDASLTAGLDSETRIWSTKRTVCLWQGSLAQRSVSPSIREGPFHTVTSTPSSLICEVCGHCPCFKLTQPSVTFTPHDLEFAISNPENLRKSLATMGCPSRAQVFLRLASRKRLFWRVRGRLVLPLVVALVLPE